MNRRQYLIGNIEGPDADIETSLKEYGLAWIETETDILFYYGINYDGDNYFLFDFCSLDHNMDIRTGYDWVDFESVESFIGIPIDELSFTQQIESLVSYYGYEEVFGSSYWEGLTYQEIMMNW